jgi:hypothetical protein
VVAHAGTPLVDPRKRQTATASPAEPGDLLMMLDLASTARKEHRTRASNRQRAVDFSNFSRKLPTEQALTNPPTDE